MEDGQNRKEYTKTAQKLRQDKSERYMKLAHAVQTGVAMTLAIDHPEVADINSNQNLREHKHLRTGIDTSKSDHGALVKLLIEKGIFTQDEYLDALLIMIQQEKEAYERKLSVHFGKQINL